MRSKKIVFLLMSLLVILVACGEEDAPVTEAVPVATAVSEHSVVDNGDEGNGETAVEAASASTNTVELTMTYTPEPTATNTPEPTPTNTPTATPEPPKEVTICMAQEPLSLYLYGDTSLVATAVRHALYENLYTSLDYQYQPQGLEKLPNLLDSDVVINEVTIGENDLVATPGGNVTELITGVTVRNSAGDLVSFDGETPITVAQMVVDFTLKPLVWSDGTPVTAADSVFSFNIAADPITPGSKFKIARTESYEVTGDLSLRWTGVPGYLDPDYFINIWQPLPSHQLGNFEAIELIEAEQTALMPLSNGPFVLTDWVIGEQMQLAVNPHYYRVAEGLPHVDNITILFQPELENLPANCDVVTQEGMNLEQAVAAEGGADYVPHFVNSGVFEHVAFGVDSVQFYGDGHQLGRPDWFEDARVRQAMTMCVDRQRLIDELSFGKAEMMHAYVPESHPLFPEDATFWPYDPAAGNALLDEVGHVDVAEDGIRQDVNSGLPFIVTLGTNVGGSLRENVISYVAEDLAACGISVQTYALPTAEWFADGPTGPMFGRQFDLAEFAWFVRIRPSCHLWLSRNITGVESQGFGGWGNVNITGWSNEAYDAACGTALLSLPGQAAFDENHQEALRVFTNELPIMPLFARVKTAVSAPTLLNFHLNPSQPSELWNVAEWDTEVIGNQ